MQLLISEHAIRRLRELENLLRQPFVLRIPLRIEPVDHVRESAHRTHFDDLLETEHTCRDSRVNAVSKPLASLLLRFDDCRGMNARSRAEGVATENGVL